MSEKNVGELLECLAVGNNPPLYLRVREAYAGDLAEMERLRLANDHREACVKMSRQLRDDAVAERDAARAELAEAVKMRDTYAWELKNRSGEQWDRMGAQLADLSQQLAEEREGRAVKHSALADMHRRIEALAMRLIDDGKLASTSMLAGDLRALLHPAEPETALGIVKRMQAGWGSAPDDEYGDLEFSTDLAKLRKLLEEE